MTSDKGPKSIFTVEKKSGEIPAFHAVKQFIAEGTFTPIQSPEHEAFGSLVSLRLDDSMKPELVEAVVAKYVEDGNGHHIANIDGHRHLIMGPKDAAALQSCIGSGSLAQSFIEQHWQQVAEDSRSPKKRNR